jgi:hypothetical protein
MSLGKIGNLFSVSNAHAIFVSNPQPNPGIELAAAHGFDGDRREIKTNGCNDRASDNGRHQSFNPANAGGRGLMSSDWSGYLPS